MFLDLVRETAGEEKDAGTNYHYNCPLCGDLKHRFYINKKTGMWFCHNEQRGGNPYQFVMELYSVGFKEASDILESYGYEQNDWRPKEGETELTSEELLRLHIKTQGRSRTMNQESEKRRLTCPPFPSNTKLLMNNFNNPEAYPFFNYLHQRGVELNQIKKYRICYCPRGTFERGDGKEISLFNHLVFPATVNGKVAYWNTRSIDKQAMIKSFNAPEQEGTHSAGDVVFNLDRAKKTGSIVIQEGVFDALTTGDSGVATYGKGVTKKQAKMVVEAAKETNSNVYLYLDKDAWKHLVHYRKRLHSLEPELPVYYVLPKTREDANDLGRQKVWELIDSAVYGDRGGDIQVNLAMHV